MIHVGRHAHPFFLDPVGVEQRPEAPQAGEGDGGQQFVGVLLGIKASQLGQVGHDQASTKLAQHSADLRVGAGEHHADQRDQRHAFHHAFDQAIHRLGKQDGRREDHDRELAPPQGLGLLRPSAGPVGQRGHGRPPGGCKRAEPEKRDSEQQPQGDAEGAVQPKEAAKDPLTRQDRITADFEGQRKLQQTGGDQQKQKCQAVFGDDVRPPDQLATALGQGHPDQPGAQPFPQTAAGGQRAAIKAGRFPGHGPPL